MATRKHTPHLRLKALRKIVDLTQEKLARLLGVSYPYLLSIETGQRELTDAVAKRVVIETGISGEWINGKGPVGSPVDIAGRPYTDASYREWKEPAIAPYDSVAPHYDAKMQRGLWLVAQFLRAAARSGRFGPAMHLLQWALDDSAKSLGIVERYNDERWTQPDPLLEAVGLGITDKATTTRAFGAAVELLDQAAAKAGVSGIIDEMRAHGAAAEAAHCAASVLSPAFVCRVRESANSGDRLGATKALEFAGTTFPEVARRLIGSKRPASEPEPKKAGARWAAAAAQKLATEPAVEQQSAGDTKARKDTKARARTKAPRRAGKRSTAKK